MKKKHRLFPFLVSVEHGAHALGLIVSFPLFVSFLSNNIPSLPLSD